MPDSDDRMLHTFVTADLYNNVNAERARDSLTWKEVSEEALTLWLAARSARKARK